MFDNVLAVIQGGAQHVSHDTRVTVNEHRAPTDDSIRLFREMQDKAWDSVVQAFTLETVFGTANIFEYKDPDWFGTTYAGFIKINEQELNFKIRITDIEKRALYPNYAEHVFNNLVKELAKTIAAKMMAEAINSSNLFTKQYPLGGC